MKTRTNLRKTMVAILLLSASPSVFSQNWRLGGNPDNIPPPQGLLSNSNFFGATQTASLELGTAATSRLFIAGTNYALPGFIGIGDNFLAPQFRLHVSDGGILSTNNTFGAGTVLPNGLTDSRFIWYPRSAAIRAGEANAQWDPGNIGDHSAAFGENTIASGQYSFAMGASCEASGVASVATGNSTIASGPNSSAHGFTSQATNFAAFATGLSTQATGEGSFTAGSGAIASGQHAAAFGNTTLASGAGAFAIGPQGAIAQGIGSFAGGFTVTAQNMGDFVFGEGSTASGGFSTCFGNGSTASGARSFVVGGVASATALSSMALGTRMQATADGAVTIGNNQAGSPFFINNAFARSLMVGFESDRSTFFVGQSAGAGTTGRVGIGDLIGMGGQPNTKLEINADPVSPSPSGLRFTDLTTATPTVPNPGTGVLAVNGAGDVIYVDAAAPPGGLVTADNGLTVAPTTDNVQWGQVNSGTGALNGGELLHDTEIPMNEFDVIFPGASTLKNNMALGAAPLPFARLRVFRETNQAITLPIAVGGWFEAQNAWAVPNNNTLVGVWSRADQAGGSTCQTIQGGLFQGTGQTSVGTFGIRGQGFTGNRVTGVDGLAIGILTAGTTATGGNFRAVGADNNIGVRAQGDNAAGFFLGDIFCTGTGSNCPSDINLKDNVQAMSGALTLIDQLEPKNFTFKTSTYPHLSLPSGTQMGLIAQDVENVLPGLVKSFTAPAAYDTAGVQISPETTYKNVNIDGFIPLLIQGMKEQQAVIETQDSLITDLQSQIDAIAQTVNGCCGSNHAMESIGGPQPHTQDVELKDVRSIVLEQNVPNPFAERTMISYDIPETTRRAQILFHDARGKLINAVDLSGTGAGQLNVFASDLSTGIYTYTLVVDGEIIDTKRMVRK